MSECFRIYYPKSKTEVRRWNSEYGLNAYYAGKHWSRRKQDADYWHLLTISAMNRDEVRRRPFTRPVILTFWFNDRLDCSNHAMYIKMIEDGMKGRIIEDDSKKYVKGIECYFHDEDYILVQIREVQHE